MMAFKKFVTVEDPGLVEVETRIEFPRNAKDAKFLACAISAGADFFITGDRDFEEARRILTTTILSVSMFEKLVCERWKP